MKKKISTIQRDWQITKLGEVSDILSGSTPSTTEASYWDGEIPWITPKDLSGYFSVYISRGERNITQEGLKNSSAKKLPKNTILFSSRAPIGYVAIAKNEVATNQGFKNIICDEKKSHFVFFYYWLKNNSDYIESISSGSTFSEVSATVMRGLTVNLPSFSEQRAIAEILLSLDDKIELLREQNKTLEAIAQSIFNEWFANFNFPGSTKKVISSELGDIPVGWKVFDLREIVETVNGYSYKGDELRDSGDEALVTLKSFDRTGGFQIRGFKPFSGNPKKDQEVVLGDLIVAHTDLTQNAEVLGNPAFIFDNGGYKKMYITMDLVKIISKNKDISLGFFYYLMSATRFKKHCVGYSNGTTVLHLSKRAIPEYKIALPDNLFVVKEFSKISNAITQKIINNFSQIQTLSSLRDTLLPKLMKGEIRVKGFNR